MTATPADTDYEPWAILLDAAFPPDGLGSNVPVMPGEAQMAMAMRDMLKQPVEPTYELLARRLLYRFAIYLAAEVPPF